MAMNLPGELVWVLDMLGYDWPPLDEDEMRRAANIIRTFKDDIEGTIDQATARIKDDVGSAMKAQAATSFGNAWDTNRQQNVEKLVDVLDPAATGIDIAADAVLALKVKVIAELVITAAQIAAAAASAAFTLGASLAANAAIIALRKKLLDVATNIAIDQLAARLLPMVVEPLFNQAVPAVMAMLDSPIVEGQTGDVSEFGADLAALDQAAADLDANGDDQEALAEDFLSQLSSCQIFTG
ncbi:WXG100 family type VII secretion target [Agrococcus terreus]|uniref:WXG100 family type VII secretion target n=1 Tax=Agrococcus terreus TaxID=574649 RepID=UPI00384FC672